MEEIDRVKIELGPAYRDLLIWEFRLFRRSDRLRKLMNLNAPMTLLMKELELLAQAATEVARLANEIGTQNGPKN